MRGFPSLSFVLRHPLLEKLEKRVPEHYLFGKNSKYSISKQLIPSYFATTVDHCHTFLLEKTFMKEVLHVLSLMRKVHSFTKELKLLTD